MNTTAIQTQNESDVRIARPLNVLAPLIKQDIEQGKQAMEKAGMPYFIAAGEKLIEAKATCKYGEFENWVKSNFNVTRQTAFNWMKAARKTQMSNAFDFSSLRQAIKIEPKKKESDRVFFPRKKSRRV
jgi:hypothetical protein